MRYSDKIQADCLICRLGDPKPYEIISVNDVERRSAVQEAQYEAIEDTLEEIKGTVNVLAAKPGKRWDSTTGEIIKLLIQAVLSEVNWAVVASASVLAGVLSLLTSVAGLPEVE